MVPFARCSDTKQRLPQAFRRAALTPHFDTDVGHKSLLLQRVTWLAPFKKGIGLFAQLFAPAAELEYVGNEHNWERYERCETRKESDQAHNRRDDPSEHRRQAIVRFAKGVI